VARLWKAAVLGLAIAVLGVIVGLSPLGLDLEDGVGLGVLFRLRGPRPVPAEVVVVSVDRTSADALELPSEFAKWPRSEHARLTDRLSRAGAAVIVFDVFFADEGRSAGDDAIFAAALERAGNVVLAKYLAREVIALRDGSGIDPAHANIERLIGPLPLFARAAAGSAPFPLPRVPVRVGQWWTFKRGAGDVPTLPVVAFHVFAGGAHGRLVDLLARHRELPRAPGARGHPDRIDETVAAIRQDFAGDRRLAAGALELVAAAPADASTDPRLGTLVRLHTGPDSRYFDFYGPPRTITTIAYRDILADPDTLPAPLPDLRGKAVFVGMAGHLRSEQRDDFHTVFADTAGIGLSGVEIAATAFANLLENRQVHPVDWPPHVAVLVLWGVLVGIVCRMLSPLAALGAALAAGAVYLLTAARLFAADGSWLPLAVPLLLQTPAALGGALLWHYLDTNRERQTIRRAFSYYLPDRVIDDLTASRGGVGPRAQPVYGICLCTDAERYTALAESLDPSSLADVMNRYYAAVFEPIRRRGGIISDVVGDSALAIWSATAPEPALRAQACEAACDVAAAVARFNREAPDLRLLTRVGLHAGQIVLGHVGAMDHYEYRAVGDIVNTATRIQALNKHFGTRLLASAEVIDGVDGVLTRKLGTFLLAGKSRPLVIHEIVGLRTQATREDVRRAALFTEALGAYEGRRWEEASAGFAALLGEGEDRAARFYLDACRQHREREPDRAWDAVVRMDVK
jgi:adenylate cyclase